VAVARCDQLGKKARAYRRNSAQGTYAADWSYVGGIAAAKARRGLCRPSPSMMN
jgi:hypothetical protein